MKNLELAKYWYYRLIDNFSDENFKIDTNFGWKKNALEIYLIKNLIKPQKGLDIKERISLRLDAALHYGKDYNDYIQYSNSKICKYLWNKKPDGLTYSKFLKTKAGKLSDSELITNAKRIKPFTYYTYDEINLQECLDRDGLELIHIPPTREKFISDYAFNYFHRHHQPAREELDDLEKFLSGIEPPFDPKFKKFLRSIGIGYFKAIISKFIEFAKVIIKINYKLIHSLNNRSKVQTKDDGIERSDDNGISDDQLETIDENIFAFKGDGWNIVFEGKDYIIRHTKGMDYIKYLLRHENVEFPIQLLTQALSDNTIDYPQGFSHMNKDALDAISLYTDKPEPLKIYDRQALIEIRKEKRKLNEELAEVKKNNDPGREEEVMQKLDQINEIVLKATRPGGFVKTVDNPEKREIRRISRLIVTALNNIKTKDKNLYLHLNNSIKKGQVFAYKPDRLMDWTLI